MECVSHMRSKCISASGISSRSGMWSPRMRCLRSTPPVASVGMMDFHRSAGFSLIEVLVTLVVLGIGMLGLAVLQVTGLRVNDGALMRTRAALAANDLADRLRAQPGEFFAGGQSANGIIHLAAGACAPPPACSSAVTCWQRDFCLNYQPTEASAGSLPSPASGADPVTVDCQNGNPCGTGNCAIIIRWSDERAGRGVSGGGGDAQFQFCTRLASAL